MGNNNNRQLLIMRHGKANWEIEIDDLKRPVTARGEEEARNIGRWLNNHSYRPDIIFSSNATRALATSNFMVEHAEFKVPEGWLCAKIIPVAPSSNAFLSAKRTSTNVPVIPPLLNCFF